MPDRQLGGPASRAVRPRLLDDGFRGGPGIPPEPAVPQPTRGGPTTAAKGLEVFDVLTDALIRHGGEPRGTYGEWSRRIFRELVDGGVGGRAILAMTAYGDPLKERHVGRARAMGRPALRAGIDPETIDRLAGFFERSLPETTPPNRQGRLAAALVDMALLDMRDGVPPDAAIRRTGLLFINDRLRDLAADRGPLPPVIPHDPPAPWQAQAMAAGSNPALRRTDLDVVPEPDAESTDGISLIGPGGVNTDEAKAKALPGVVAEPTLLDRLLRRAGKAAAESFKGEIGISEETFRRLQEAGVFRRGDETPFGAVATVRQFNEILLGGGATAVDLVLRSSEALIFGTIGGFAQFVEELGMDRGDAGRLERDIAAAVALGTRRIGSGKPPRKPRKPSRDPMDNFRNRAAIEEGQAVDLATTRFPELAIGKKIPTQVTLQSGKRPDGLDLEAQLVVEFKKQGHTKKKRSMKKLKSDVEDANAQFGGDFMGILAEPADDAFKGLTRKDVAEIPKAEIRKLFRQKFKIVGIIDRKNKK